MSMVENRKIGSRLGRIRYKDKLGYNSKMKDEDMCAIMLAERVRQGKRVGYNNKLRMRICYNTC